MLNRLKFVVLIALAASFSIGVVVGVGLSGVSLTSTAKSTLKRADVLLFRGALLTLYGRERIPKSVEASLPDAYDWIEAQQFLTIAHGLGPQLWAGANTKQTFEEGVRRGFRLFEVDIAMTSDNHVICFHGTDESQLDRMSFSDYKQDVARQGITPLEFSDLITMARANPQIRFVLDVKNRYVETYREIRKMAILSGTGKSFIPQVYSFDQLPQFRSEPIFAGEIFSSYRSHLTTARIFELANQFGVRVVTLTRERVDQEPTFPASLVVLTHPVDNVFEAALLRGRGIRGIYSSYLAPLDQPELFQPWPPGCEPGENWTHCSIGKQDQKQATLPGSR